MLAILYKYNELIEKVNFNRQLNINRFKNL